MSSALFRFIGSIGRNIIVANTFGSFGLLVIFVLGGFIVARGKVSVCKRFIKQEVIFLHYFHFNLISCR